MCKRSSVDYVSAVENKRVCTSLQQILACDNACHRATDWKGPSKRESVSDFGQMFISRALIYFNASQKFFPFTAQDNNSAKIVV